MSSSRCLVNVGREVAGGEVVCDTEIEIIEFWVVRCSAGHRFKAPRDELEGRTW